MDNLNLLLKYLVNDDDIKKIANATNVEEKIVKDTCISLFDNLIPSDFSRYEGSHLEKKDLNAIMANFNKLLDGSDLKRIINNISLDNAIEQSSVAHVIKELLVNIRGRLQYMSAVKKKPEDNDIKKDNEIKDKENTIVEKENFSKNKVVTNKKSFKQKTQSIDEEVVDNKDDSELASGEKVALYVLAALTIAVIIVIIVIIFKIMRG